MENKQNNDGPKETTSRELPLHFRLMDVYLDQVEKSVPLLTTMVKDLQNVYISGAQVALKAGELLEERSKINVNFFRSAGKTLETVTPVITSAQIGVTRAIVDSACQSIRLLRKSITGNK